MPTRDGIAGRLKWRRAVVDALQVTEHVVRRWVRYGHDRLYVQTADGTSLGYWDNKAGCAVVQDERCRSAVEMAAADFRAAGRAAPVDATRVVSPDGGSLSETAHLFGGSEPLPVDEIAVDTTVPALPAALSPVDLALNRPGQAARDQAIALRQAAPVKTMLARVLGVHTEERAWRIGADGESAVAAQLAKLGLDWFVLHAIPVGERGSDIDHLVIGPAGVFTINAKHHPDASVWVGGNTFLVNGQREPYVRNSRHEAQRASRLLAAAVGFPVAVNGVIAVMGAQKGFTIREQPPNGDVHVVTRREIARWLVQRPAVATTADRTHSLYEAARCSTTWQAR